MRAVRSSFLTHYWLGRLCAGSWKQFFLLTIGSGGPLCGQLEAVFLLTIGWGDFVRAVGSSFSYSLLPRGGLCGQLEAVYWHQIFPILKNFKIQNPNLDNHFLRWILLCSFFKVVVFFFTFVLLFVIAVLLVLINLLV